MIFIIIFIIILFLIIYWLCFYNNNYSKKIRFLLNKKKFRNKIKNNSWNFYYNRLLLDFFNNSLYLYNIDDIYYKRWILFYNKDIEDEDTFYLLLALFIYYRLNDITNNNISLNEIDKRNIDQKILINNITKQYTEISYIYWYYILNEMYKWNINNFLKCLY